MNQLDDISVDLQYFSNDNDLNVYLLKKIMKY